MTLHKILQIIKNQIFENGVLKLTLDGVLILISSSSGTSFNTSS
jgi:hypothetical protein